MAPTEWGTLAHRISYGLHVGPIPKGGGVCVCHKCDNPKCVNPDHLFLGSHADNIADRDVKGRQVTLKGSKNVNAKLTEAAVKEIKLLLASGVMQKLIAKQFDVSQSNVSDIKRGRIWGHI
jgi:predicted XRE-type DNA-binding protein